ncbi:MAG TPA: class I SAM-dependent methyltransferase [Leeuwenhoekiella sp.]|nr:class I SAM-dependent methyltransferase [Leeuwenhoekiella sp.]
MAERIYTENDVFGAALLDFYNGDKDAEITVHSSLTEDDVIPVQYLFREYNDMPLLEQKALDKAYGKVLDIGACSGSHALYLQEKGIDVTALDSSPGAIAVIKKRGIKQTVCSTILDYEQEGFDTMLLLMNGTGIFESIGHSGKYLRHLHKLLNHGGQILVDATDIHYMFEEEDGNYWVDLNQDYYGEVRFQLRYKEKKTASFDWLYLDYKNLEQLALNAGFTAKLLEKGPESTYLAQLVKI